MKKFDAAEMTTKLINDWLEQTRGLPITLQLTKLSFAVIGGLEAAYELGKKAEAKSWIAEAIDEILADEAADGPEGVDGPDDAGVFGVGPDDEIPF